MKNKKSLQTKLLEGVLSISLLIPLQGCDWITNAYVGDSSREITHRAFISGWYHQIPINCSYCHREFEHLVGPYNLLKGGEK